MIDTELNDALDAYSQRLKVLSEQATIRNMIRGASHQPNNDEATCQDIDEVIEGLALVGDYEQAERLRKVQVDHA